MKQRKWFHDLQTCRTQEDLKLNHGDPSQIQALVIIESEFSAINNLRLFYRPLRYICNSFYILASTRENLSWEVYEQQMRRPARASAKSDQLLCYSLFGKHQI